MATELTEPKRDMGDPLFDKDRQYGEFVEIVPVGEFSIHSTRCFSGTWCLRDVEKVKGTLVGEAKAFVPREYWPGIEVIMKPPTFTMDPYTQHGTVGWKYTPLQKGGE